MLLDQYMLDITIQYQLFPDVQPADFVPYIEYKSQLRVYQWIGAGRDSDGHLEPLAQFWLANK